MSKIKQHKIKESGMNLIYMYPEYLYNKTPEQMTNQLYDSLDGCGNVKKHQFGRVCFNIYPISIKTNQEPLGKFVRGLDIAPVFEEVQKIGFEHLDGILIHDTWNYPDSIRDWGQHGYHEMKVHAEIVKSINEQLPNLDKRRVVIDSLHNWDKEFDGMAITKSSQIFGTLIEYFNSIRNTKEQKS